MRSVISIVPLAVSCMFTSYAAGAVINGNFEFPDVPATGYTDADPTGWVVTESQSFQISMFDRADFPGPSGSQMLSFNAGGTPVGSSIHQSFSTVNGASYTVSFRAAANVPSRSSVTAAVHEGLGMGGTVLASTVSAGGTPFHFVQTTFSFQAVSNLSTLAFVDTSSQTGGSDLFLDAVVIIPEPSSALLLGLCFVIRARATTTAHNAPSRGGPKTAAP